MFHNLYEDDIMSTSTKRSAVYPDSTLHKALRLKSLETSRSMCDLINKAVREPIAEDLAVFDERAGEPLISYNEMAKKEGKYYER
jgi:hypothetical protein